MPNAPAAPPGSADPEDFRGIVSNLPAALYTTDAAGVITYFNEAAADLWGRRPAIGKDMWCGSWRLYTSDGAPLPHDECPMAITVKTGKPVRGAQAVAERPDGTRFPFTPFPTPIFDGEGKMTGAMNMLIELSSAAAPADTTRRLAAANRVATVLSRDLAIASLFDQAARMVHRRDDGLSAVQWAILRYLSRSSEAREESQIAGFLGFTDASIARDLSVLHRHGFIGRIANPLAHAGGIALTDHGRAALQVDPVKRLAGAVAQLSEEKRTVFAEALEILADHLSRDGNPPQ